MTEPETEIDTLDRLEAALGQIAARTARTDTTPSACTRMDVAQALDRLIAQLRDALASIGEAEHG